jgi:hypothetical protein
MQQSIFAKSRLSVFEYIIKAFSKNNEALIFNDNGYITAHKVHLNVLPMLQPLQSVAPRKNAKASYPL